MKHYILEGKDIIESNSLEWARYFEKADRRVNRYERGDVVVSTVFLGLDHRVIGEGKAPPILFETLVFGGELDGEMERYCTYDEAEEGHEQMCKKVFNLDTV